MTRVLIRDMPRLVSDILTQAISTQSDMELVREDRPDLARKAKAVSPDVVILGTTTAEESHEVSALLLQWPQAQVLLITVEGRTAALYELVPHKTALGEMSPSELVDAIRASVKRSRMQATSRLQ